MSDFIDRDGDTITYNTAERYYTIMPDVFIKRQAKAHEVRYRKIDGKVAEHPFNRQRIENERDAIAFISRNTSIPVPRILEWSDEDGVGCLTYETLKGETLGNIYGDLDPEAQQRLGDNVTKFIREVLLLELNRLRSKTMGQLSGVVFPPPRITGYDQRPEWQSRTSSTDRYVYCHNDLDTQNFMIDKETLEVEAVIDWEYSGFFPPQMEFPFWAEGKEASLEEAHCREMIALLDAPGKSNVAALDVVAVH
ncbi:MAG: hypothetical protein LQ352_002268 [Teloschistes flavicans]|nr:MAG: hypothetical protein LQ352_002268 [Teloschistes flavicans]